MSIDELRPLCSQLYTQLKEYLRLMRNDFVVPLLVIEMGCMEEMFDKADKEGNTPEAVSHLVHAILLAKVVPTFHKINVHAAMTPSEVKSQLRPVFSQANVLLKRCQQKVLRKNVDVVERALTVDSEEMPLVTVRTI